MTDQERKNLSLDSLKKIDSYALGMILFDLISDPQKKKTGDEPQRAGEELSSQNSMDSLMLKGLKPDEEFRAPESLSDDEDAIKLVDRKISLNQNNVVGLDFEKYNDLKPTQT
jgi:hypothetical protein